MSKPFVKVKLHSGVGGEPLGAKNLVIYYECDPNAKSIIDTDIISYDDELLEWVNTCGRFQKGDSNEDYEFDSNSTLELVFLNDIEITTVQKAGHLVRKIDLRL